MHKISSLKKTCFTSPKTMRLIFENLDNHIDNKNLFIIFLFI
jgi:hypothetical protein